MSRTDALYCSTRCRVAAHRNPLPGELIRAHRWIRYAADKRPRTVDGRAASSTDPGTWSPFADARRSSAGIGLGFVLGDGYAGIDIDHCLIDGNPTEAARAFLGRYPEHYIEISPSGDGLHILGRADPGPGSKRIENGLRIERYSTARYFTITGRVFQRGRLLPL